MDLHLNPEDAAYSPPSLELAGPGCLSDLQWSDLRRSKKEFWPPPDTTLRAHLVSCTRCRSRMRPLIQDLGLESFEREVFPEEFLCLSDESLSIALQDRSRLSEAQQSHLQNCGTCIVDFQHLAQGKDLRAFIRTMESKK